MSYDFFGMGGIVGGIREMRNAEFGVRNVDRSAQSPVPPTADLRYAPTSVLSRVFGGDPQGSAFQMGAATGPPWRTALRDGGFEIPDLKFEI